MPLINDSNLKRMKKVNDIYNKERGKLKKPKYANKTANYIKEVNPLDYKIDTYEKFLKENNDFIDSSRTSMKNINSLKNTHVNKQSFNKRERQFLIAGKYIEYKNIKGFINRIDNNYIYIEAGSDIVKISFKDYFKNLKPEKKKPVVNDISLIGPNNKSISKKPKEDKTKIKYLQKSKVTKINDLKEMLLFDEYFKSLND